MKTAAFMTASYAGDFERCCLLCESMDRFATGYSAHYILVEADDVARFKALEGPKRVIVSERDLLPDWLHVAGPSMLTRGRRMWWSSRTMPLRGWHVQQLRRIAFAAKADEDALLSCDSDMVFVRPYDIATLWKGAELRLYCVPDGINEATPNRGRNHLAWARHAAALFGVPVPSLPVNDYINNMVSWSSRETASMCAAIEQKSGRHWVSAIARSRGYSECLIYGMWVDGVRGGAGHWHDPRPLCRTYWNGAALGVGALEEFIETIEPYQVAIGLQSFTGTNGNLIRPLLGL